MFDRLCPPPWEFLGDNPGHSTYLFACAYVRVHLSARRLPTDAGRKVPWGTTSTNPIPPVVKYWSLPTVLNQPECQSFKLPFRRPVSVTSSLVCVASGQNLE
ncbi:Hypothetical protein NTJ_11023 [Nesidiocoris tenuis]|uniref:Uncharacterized protein n=1 Tax=Nesidiocoris tenuis TaxID=355587 RepID=A0ABN7B3J7_9HEMI|nr:Hypothetical protein NTJ_11023 [Nesidiocoris tenuis]